MFHITHTFRVTVNISGIRATCFLEYSSVHIWESCQHIFSKKPQSIFQNADIQNKHALKKVCSRPLGPQDLVFLNQNR